MDETGANYTEWSKPERKTPIQCTNTLNLNLKLWQEILIHNSFSLYNAKKGMCSWQNLGEEFE